MQMYMWIAAGVDVSCCSCTGVFVCVLVCVCLYVLSFLLFICIMFLCVPVSMLLWVDLCMSMR